MASLEERQDLENRRVFFALWPSEQVADQLVALQRAQPIAGKLVAPASLHITLAFIGAAAPDYLACLHETAQGVSFPPFSLALNKLGYFKKPRIAWVGPSQPPAALMALHASLTDTLSTCGYAPEARAFRPHVTLARKAAPVQTTDVATIDWPVASFVLAESQLSETGPRYRILQRYPAETRSSLRT